MSGTDVSHRYALLAASVLVLASAAGCGGGSSSSGPSAREGGAARDRPPEDRPAARAVAWTEAQLTQRLAGRRVRVGDRTVQIDPNTVTCVGQGPKRQTRPPAWTRFRCVQPTFERGAVAGPDLVFIAAPTGPRSLVVREQRLTTY